MSLVHKFAIQLFILPIKGYRLFVSPLLGPRCRFVPTCSEYALDAYNKYGIIKGTDLTIRRLLRCHPWNPGGYDPVK